MSPPPKDLRSLLSFVALACYSFFKEVDTYFVGMKLNPLECEGAVETTIVYTPLTCVFRYSSEKSSAIWASVKALVTKSFTTYGS